MRLAFAVFVLCSIQQASGQRILKSDQETLKGLSSFHVSLTGDDVTPALKEAGVDRSDVQTAVELRLRSLGLQVTSEEGTTYLEVTITGICHADTPWCAVTYNLSFRQPAIVRANGGLWMCRTWSAATTLLSTKTSLQEDWKTHLLRIVDSFANSYLQQNPRK